MKKFNTLEDFIDYLNENELQAFTKRGYARCFSFKQPFLEDYNDDTVYYLTDRGGEGKCKVSSLSRIFKFN